MSSGNSEDAVKYFGSLHGEAEPDLESSISSTAYNLAWIYLQQGNQGRALTLLDNIIQHTQSAELQADALARRSYLLSLAFDYEAAIQDIDRAIEMYPQNPEYHLRRGQVIMLLYEWDNVMASYNTALELRPDYADAYFYRGVLFYSVLERRLALADFKKYLSLTPGGLLTEQAEQYIRSIQQELSSLRQNN